MSLMRIQVFKTQTGDRFWTNVYHVNATTLAAAAAFANDVIATFEQGILLPVFSVVKTLVSDVPSAGFIDTPLNLPGTADSSPYLPLFNTVKVNITVDAPGRNDYKFYRGFLSENGVTNGQVDPVFLALVVDGLAGVIADGTAAGVDLVDTDSNLWVDVSGQSKIQMRQLHRKRKKVVTPP